MSKITSLARKSREDLTGTLQVTELGKFLRDCAYCEKNDGEHFDRIVINHLTAGNRKGEEVCFYRVPKSANDEWSESQALEICQRLAMEAEALTGFQKYSVYAFTNLNNTDHFARHLVKIQSRGPDDSADALDTEDTSPRGQVAQSMRHLEAMAKTTVAATSAAAMAMGNLIQRQGEMIDNMMDSQADVLRLAKELADDKHQRELDYRTADLKANAQQEGFKKLALLAPVLVNKIAGKTIIPIEAQSIMMQARSLLGSIAADEKKMGALAQALSPEEMACFINLYDEISKSTHDKDGKE